MYSPGDGGFMPILVREKGRLEKNHEYIRDVLPKGKLWWFDTRKSVIDDKLHQ